jgi:hypothetical protein
MKLPIPSFDERYTGYVNSVIRKMMQRAVKTALKDIDLQELYQELVEKTDNMAPLTEGEFRQVESQWVFMRVLQGDYLYLMFKADDNSEGRKTNPNDNTLLFFVEVRPMPKWIDGELSPKRNKDWSWDSFTILSYEDSYDDILSWANVYLVKSYGMPSFMNWKGNPFIK